MVRIRRWVEADKVYQMCNRNNYYTRGDNYAYGNMLAMCREAEDDTEYIKQIAIDIYHHSTLMDDKEYSPEDHVAGIMGEILRTCMDLYVEIEDEVIR